MIDGRRHPGPLRWAVAALVALLAVTGLAGSVWFVSRLVTWSTGARGFAGTDVTFVDEQHGWVLGSGHCRGARFCLIVKRTQDGGHTWQAVGRPAGVGPPPNGVECTDLGDAGPCVDHILFADVNTGYLWSGRSIYVTRDGGQTWTAQQGNAASLAATDTSVLRASAVRVEFSRPGADTWRIVTPTGAAPFPDPHLVVAAQRPAIVLLTIGQNYPVVSSDPPPSYLSRDRGRSWRPVPGVACGASDSYSGNNVLLAPDGTLVVDCYKNGTVQDSDRVFVSRDAGHTYDRPQRLPHSDLMGPRQLVAVSSHVLLYLVGPDYPASPQSVAYRSTDAGRTWQKAATTPEDPTFVSPEFGYALTSSSGAVAVTTDGGANWHTYRIR